MILFLTTFFMIVGFIAYIMGPVKSSESSYSCFSRYKFFSTIGLPFRIVFRLTEQLFYRIPLMNLSASESFAMLIVCCVALLINIGLFSIIGSFILPTMFDTIKDVLLDVLSGKGIAIIDMIKVIIGSPLSSIGELFSYRIIYVVLLCSSYLSGIYYGLDDLDQINNYSRFKVRSLTKKNIFIMFFLILIINLLFGFNNQTRVIQTLLIIIDLVSLQTTLISAVVVVAPIKGFNTFVNKKRFKLDRIGRKF